MKKLKEKLAPKLPVVCKCGSPTAGRDECFECLFPRETDKEKMKARYF